MESYQRWIWQHQDWPGWTFDHGTIQGSLSQTRQSLGSLLSLAELVGVEVLQTQIAESLMQEALTTSLIEGFNCNQ
jgi:Fic family protein